jgi:hypothetical protein
MPCSAGARPVVNDVSAVVVVDGTTVLIGPPVSPDTVGITSRWSSTSCQPKPSIINSTTELASRAASGTQASRALRARTRLAMHGPA